MRACAWCGMRVRGMRAYCSDACQVRSRGAGSGPERLLSSEECDAIAELREARRRVDEARRALRVALGWDAPDAAPGREHLDGWAGYVSPAGWGT